MFIRIQFLFLLIIYGTVTGYSQQLFLVNKQQKVPLIQNSLIGLTTTRDTVIYNEYKNLSFRIYTIDSNSIVLRRPTSHTDTVIQYYNGVYNSLPFEFQVGKFFKKDKIQYVRLIKLTGFETLNFPLKDITSVTYPTKKSNGDGCVGCFFIPGINVWYILSTTSKTKAKKKDMSRWKFETK